MTVSTLTNIWPPAFLAFFLAFLPGCQLPYLVSGAFEQVRILSSRQKIEKAIESVALDPPAKDKLLFAIKAKDFASKHHLTCKDNFKTYVELGRPYVSYLVIASKKDEVRAKTWWFPVVGSFPYKGYFSEKEAQASIKKLKQKNYDTYTRGVNAYSSLGWFDEPIMSSMLKNGKYNLAETIFHECFHTTFFIKSNNQINERLAVFFAHHFMVEFLESLGDRAQKEKEQLSWEDSKKFSLFLKSTIESSIEFYKNQKNEPAKRNREKLFTSIKKNYVENLKPKLKSNNYDHVFLKDDLNNAKLAAFKTYFHKFESLEEQLQSEFDGDIFKFLFAAKEPKNKAQRLKFFKN